MKDVLSETLNAIKIGLIFTWMMWISTEVLMIKDDAHDTNIRTVVIGVNLENLNARVRDIEQ